MNQRDLSALVVALALAAVSPAAAQDAGGEAGRAAALDRLLGANAALPRPEPPPLAGALLPAPLPSWLAAQPYRQQPLFATVPIGGATHGRIRTPGGP